MEAGPRKVARYDLQEKLGICFDCLHLAHVEWEVRHLESQSSFTNCQALGLDFDTNGNPAPVYYCTHYKAVS